MEKILVDTDVIIDFLRGYQERIKTVFRKIENKEIKAYISFISVVELYAGEDAENKEKEMILRELLSFFEIIPLDFAMSKLAGILKRKYKLGLADSIVSASTITLNAKLFTFNVKHFKNIPTLLIYSK